MPQLYTIGHSTRTLEEFVALLQTYEIDHLLDIRSVPKSRHVPWFNEFALCSALEGKNIKYTHLAALGGLRHTSKDSPNQGWQNASFRGYADYMLTAEFLGGLASLNKYIHEGGRVAIMCAEAVPWRCHRSLIADAEIIRGVDVFHIMSPTLAQPHKLTPFACVDQTTMKIYYPASFPS